jgi:hypothetical protein
VLEPAVVGGDAPPAGALVAVDGLERLVKELKARVLGRVSATGDDFDFEIGRAIRGKAGIRAEVEAAAFFHAGKSFAAGRFHRRLAHRLQPSGMLGTGAPRHRLRVGEISAPGKRLAVIGFRRAHEFVGHAGDEDGKQRSHPTPASFSIGSNRG